MSPLPLPPFLSFTLSLSLSLSLGYWSNCLKLANLEDYDLGQSWNSNLIPPFPLLQKLKSFITSLRYCKSLATLVVTGRGDLVLIVVYKLVRN